MVAPLAAPKGRPMAWAGRSLSSVSPLEARAESLVIGRPEAPGAGECEGAEPPRPGAGPAGAPNLDTYGTTLQTVPSGPALFGPAWLSLAEYRNRAATELERLALWYAAHGKRRRDFRRKARALRTCGQFARVRRCGSCGAADAESARIQCDCDMRSCPTCARRRADTARARLDDKWRTGDRPRRMGLYFITFTLRYDPSAPDDVSVVGLKRRKTLIREAVGYVWKKYLKPRGRSMALAVEVSPRGAVHIHALYHGRRPDADELRATYTFKTGDSRIVNIKYVQRPAKAIRELAKYMMKAASPKKQQLLRGGRGEFIDPVLAARAEVAFSGDRLFECLGAWRGADDDADLPDVSPTSCVHCGSRDWHCTTVRVQALLNELPPDWIPRFGRAGPVGRKKQPRPQTEVNHVI